MHSRTQSSSDSPGSGRIRLTRRQQQALVPDRHLSVTANAGSGKTAVLVERYVRVLLDQRATMDQIVVLTFTEKAAGELRRRIASALLDSAGDVQPDKHGLLASIREQLPNAFIGTIHSFCARILREFPLEAGVDRGREILRQGASLSGLPGL